MPPLKALQWAILTVPNLLAPLSLPALLAQLPSNAAAAAIEFRQQPQQQQQQFVLQASNPEPNKEHSTSTAAASPRRLRGKFLHITDLHPDEHYKPHTSTEENIACHRGDGPAGVYGAETSDCDSPLSLVDATLAWVKEHLADEIDFVVWTGDSARHDSDEEQPRHDKDILAMNRRIANAFVDTFSDDTGLVVPVVPTFGNNDIYPHNILLPGPNDILRTYTSIWRPFIPEAQRHSFEFGGWFYVEVIPNHLAVFSLNTMYFFDRNAGIDDCVHPSEPGYKHFEWLLVQLEYLRGRGMKAILMGHVPPARTAGKQLWEETCWQKYALWLDRYRDVVTSSLYGHMNIDHFLLQDTREIDMDSIRDPGTGTSTIKSTTSAGTTTTHQSGDEEISIQAGVSYLKELRDVWAKLPSPAAMERDADESTKRRGRGKKGGKDKFGGKWAERYQLSLISPSVVPNYLPGLRVFEYNITGLEDAPSWMDTTRAISLGNESSNRDEEVYDISELKKRDDSDIEAEKKKKKEKNNGKAPPKDPKLRLPEPPARGTSPGPAYLPQTLTLLGYTQYYANLTYINNDIVSGLESKEGGDAPSATGWNPGKHDGKKPGHNGKPNPHEFGFEVEYSTFNDTIYGLDDLTVRSFVRLAHRIGQATEKSNEDISFVDDEDENEINGYNDDDDADENEYDEWGVEEEESQKKNKHKKGKGKGKGKGKKDKKNRKTWLHFLMHAFVSTKTKEELEEL